MALVTEDGTGLSTAESYVSVTTADAYWSARNNTTWAALTTAVKEANLRIATEYLSRYTGKWRGLRVKTTQALDWPRSEVCVDNVVIAYNVLPGQLVRAVCELAAKVVSGSLIVDESAQVVSESIGPISTTYAQGARQQTRYAYVDALLAPLLRAGNGISVVRG